jgi:hypothetical protein
MVRRMGKLAPFEVVATTVAPFRQLLCGILDGMSCRPR